MHTRPTDVFMRCGVPTTRRFKNFDLYFGWKELKLMVTSL